MESITREFVRDACNIGTFALTAVLVLQGTKNGETTMRFWFTLAAVVGLCIAAYWNLRAAHLKYSRAAGVSRANDAEKRQRVRDLLLRGDSLADRVPQAKAQSDFVDFWRSEVQDWRGLVRAHLQHFYGTNVAEKFMSQRAPAQPPRVEIHPDVKSEYEILDRSRTNLATIKHEISG